MKTSILVGVGMVGTEGFLRYHAFEGDCFSQWRNAVWNDDLVHRKMIDLVYDRTDDVIQEHNKRILDWELIPE